MAGGFVRIVFRRAVVNGNDKDDSVNDSRNDRDLDKTGGYYVKK